MLVAEVFSSFILRYQAENGILFDTYCAKRTQFLTAVAAYTFIMTDNGSFLTAFHQHINGMNRTAPDTFTAANTFTSINFRFRLKPSVYAAAEKIGKPSKNGKGALRIRRLKRYGI